MNKLQEYQTYLWLTRYFLRPQQTVPKNVAQAFASITVPLNWSGKPGEDVRPYLPVKLYNVKTDKPAVNLNMLVDTGASNTIIGGQHAKPLGIDNLKKSKITAVMAGIGQQSTTYQHNIKIQIGSLTPVTVPIYLRENTSELSLLGWKDVLDKAKLEVLSSVEKKQFRYTEQAVAALGSAQAYFRSRI